MMVKSGLEFFYFEIERALSELLLPSAKNGPERLNWPVSLKGLGQFQNKKILDHFLRSFLSQKWSFQELRVHL